MLVPPLDLGSPDGLAAYPAQPRVNDTSGERGGRIVGTRVESTTFVAESEGRYTLPAVELAWWDVATAELRQATADAIYIEVVANPDLAVAFALPEEDPSVLGGGEPSARISVLDALRRWGVPLLGLAAFVYLGAWVLRRFGVDVEDLLRGDATDREEELRFRAFRDAARSQQAAETARSFMRWLDFRNRGPGTFAAFAAKARDAELYDQARALAESVYGRPEAAPREWSGRVLASRVEKARREASKKEEAASAEPALPPLNP
jgi:hypothetical protein